MIDNQPERLRMPRIISAGTIAFALIIFLCCPGCGERNVDDLAEYLEWLNNPDHGLTQTISASEVRITAKYLPSEYRAYLDRREGSAPDRSAIDGYANSVSFMINIASNGDGGSREPSGLNALAGRQDLTSYAETVAENPGEYFALDAGGAVYRPVLAMLDHDYGMGPARTIVLVFADERGGKKFDNTAHIELVVKAGALGIPVSRFRFSQDAIADRKILDL